MAAMASFMAHAIYGVFLGEISQGSDDSTALSCSCIGTPR